MDSLKRPPFPSRFSRGAVRTFSADVPLEIVDGAPVLPALVLWALSLNEGDLLIATPSRGFETMEWDFASYVERLNAIVDAIPDVWPWLESEVFRGTLGAVGPRGALVLPDAAAALAGLGGSLCLRAEDRPASFTLAARMPSTEGFHVEARYKVQLAPDLRATLPEEALWALGLSPGDRLEGAEFFAEVRVGRRLSDGSKIDLELEAGGALRLPESMRILREGKTRGIALLILTLSPQPAFRITPWTDLEAGSLAGGDG